MIHHPTFPASLSLSDLQFRLRACEDGLGTITAIGVVGSLTVGSFDDGVDASGSLVLRPGIITDAINGQAMILGSPQDVSITRSS